MVKGFFRRFGRNSSGPSFFGPSFFGPAGLVVTGALFRSHLDRIEGYALRHLLNRLAAPEHKQNGSIWSNKALAPLAAMQEKKSAIHGVRFWLL
jgi:hypothetical protein